MNLDFYAQLVSFKFCINLLWIKLHRACSNMSEATQSYLSKEKLHQGVCQSISYEV